MNTKLSALILVLASMAFTPAHGGHRWARAIQAVPVTEQVCVDRHVRHEVASTGRTRSGNSATGTIVGGALGNRSSPKAA